MSSLSILNVKIAFVVCTFGSVVLMVVYLQALSRTHWAYEKYIFAKHGFQWPPNKMNQLKADAQLPVFGDQGKQEKATTTTYPSRIGDQSKSIKQETEKENPYKFPNEIVGLPIDFFPVNFSDPNYRSYRDERSTDGWMETNKHRDNYDFCPRKELFLGPYKYLNSSKNPCWYDENSEFRCIPYYYLAGFSKCGTSDLSQKIRSHPDVLSTGRKEKHWFDYKRFSYNFNHIENYTDIFVRASEKIKEDINNNGISSKIIYDNTPCYVWDSLKWPCYEGNEGLDEPRYTNADVIYRLNPKTKIILAIREPASRLYSRMLSWIREPVHSVYINATPEKFHGFIKDRIAMHRECFQRWSVRQCAYNGTLYRNAMLRLMEGVYHVYINDWLKVFPRKQILIVKFEDYVKNTYQILSQVYSFLELAPLPEEKMQRILKQPTVNKGAHYNVGKMLKETHDILHDFYGPFNKELSTLLGDPNANWDYS